MYFDSFDDKIHILRSSEISITFSCRLQKFYLNSKLGIKLIQNQISLDYNQESLSNVTRPRGTSKLARKCKKKNR